MRVNIKAIAKEAALKIYACIIEYLLQRQNLNLHILGDEECAIKRACILSSQNSKDSASFMHTKYEKEVLYIDLCGRYHHHNIAPTLSDGYAFLTLDTKAKNQTTQNINLENEIEILDRVNLIISNLQTWDSKLKDAITTNATLSSLATLGQQMISHEFSFIDQNLVMLMTSKKYTQVMQHKVHKANNDISDDTPMDENEHTQQSKKNAATSMLPQHVALDLIEEKRFSDASKEHKPFYYERNDGTMVYCINTHSDNRYLARFVVRLLDGSKRLHTGEEKLVEHFDGYIKLLYKRLATGSSSLSRQDDAFHKLLRSISRTDLTINASVLQSSIASYEWKISDTYGVMWFEFMDNVSWSNAGFYMACQLELQWQNSCAVADGNGILWIFNYTMMPAEKSGETFRKAFTKLLADYVCKCGVSSKFDDLTTLPARRHEAMLALKYGTIHDPSIWHYRFSNYKLEHILDSAVSELFSEQVCSKKLLELIVYDRKRTTDYARTLVCYLQNDLSASRTANKLFIHRTTLLRRLDTIKKITKIDFLDPDERAFILLSSKLLNM